MKKEYEEFHARYQNFVSQLPRQFMWELIQLGYKNQAASASRLLKEKLEKLESEIWDCLNLPIPQEDSTDQ